MNKISRQARFGPESLPSEPEPGTDVSARQLVWKAAKFGAGKATKISVAAAKRSASELRKRSGGD